MSRSSDRFRPRTIRGGVVAQSGLDLRERGSARGRLNPQEGPYRAIVVHSRVVGEDGNLRGLCVECDVLVVRTQVTVQKVPVLQRQHGVNNVHDLWVPRPSTRVIVPPGAPPAPPLNVTGTQSLRGDFIGAGTGLGSLDGDMVLLDFMEGNPSFPIIIGALTHERTNRKLVAGDGWREGEHETRGGPRRNEHYTHHYGCEVRINEQGDLLIDTVGAYSAIDTEDTSVSSGQVRVRVKTSQRLTIAMGNDEDVIQVFKDGSQLRVDLGKNADQKLVLGNDSVAAQKRALDAIDAFANALATATPAAPNGALTVAATLTAYNVMHPLIATAKNDLDAALSDLAKTKKT